MGLIAASVERRRRRASLRFLEGRGVEIGALHSPLWVSPRAQVSYVDRMEAAELRRHYPELAGTELCRVDVIDDGERLASFADGSLDFVIANHLLEHCENPLGTLRHHLAKVRPGGCLYYAVPDKRFTFDAARPLTEFGHLVRDDQEGPACSRREHFLEWVAGKVPAGTAAEAEARRLMEMGYSIHFHVWDERRYADMLRRAHDYLGRCFQVAWFEWNRGEVISVLRRSPPGPAGDPLRRAGPRWRRARWLARSAGYWLRARLPARPARLG